jgi:hypothetical protein
MALRGLHVRIQFDDEAVSKEQLLKDLNEHMDFYESDSNVTELEVSITHSWPAFAIKEVKSE